VAVASDESRYTMAMEVISLQSGSSGNCTYVESDGARLLFDAGISGAQAEQRLAQHGKDIRKVDALIISHDHRDHTACMGILHRKYGMPIYVTEPTLQATRRGMKLGVLNNVRHFRAGETISLKHLSIETIRTPHDAVDGVAFVIDDGTRRFGLLTDLGHVFAELRQVLGTLDAILLESNYDVGMLARGPYPEFLKSRISGQAGHISNLDAAELLRDHASPQLQWACLAHLSDENNDPQVAVRTHRQILGDSLPIECADRQVASQLMHVSEFHEGFAVTKQKPQTNPPKRANKRPVQQGFAWADL
jgi:phosphoribosyl 1,2-cyclic phosphodiesterase